MQGQLKQQFHQMQGKFHNFMRKYKAELSVPRFNFLKQMTKGILASQSVIVRQAARSLHEQIPLRKTSGRLYRHLDQEDLASDIHDILLASQSRRLERDSLIFIDESDIVKPYATRMEGLEKIRDASANKTESGYHLINAVALVGTPSNHSIVPLCSKIYRRVHTHKLPFEMENRRNAPATQARFRMGANSPFAVPQAEKSECDLLARCMFSLLDDFGRARITIDYDVGIYRTEK